MNKSNIYKILARALGEIILVTIGILIALQIDNWNDDRKENRELRNYLQNIANNMVQDRENLLAIIEFRDSVSFYSRKILELEKQEVISLEEFLITVHDDYNIFYDNYVEINKTGFEALKNSGYISKIHNTRIEQILYTYYGKVSSLEKQEKSLNDFIENMEVIGFEKNLFRQMIDILRRPDIEEYFDTHQENIKRLVNDPVIFGANFRGAILNTSSYNELLTLNEEVLSEIKKVTGR